MIFIFLHFLSPSDRSSSDLSEASDLVEDSLSASSLLGRLIVCGMKRVVCLRLRVGGNEG